MYNLLIALGLSIVAFLVGWLAGNWTYGIFPAMLVFGIAYVLLARRTGRQLEAVMMAVQDELSKGKVKPARKLLEAALPLGKWQLLVTQQIYAQLGALEYIQQHWSKARPLLAKAWSRNWQASAMLAALDLRQGKKDEALKRLEKMRLLGRKEPLMWAVTAYVTLKAKGANDALKVVADARKVLEDNGPLKELQQALANDKMKKFKWNVFGQGWYQFYPEHLQQGAMGGGRQQAPQFRGGKTYPMPRR